MEDVLIKKAARQFGSGEPIIELLGEGLIHKTYRASFPESGVAIVLQCLNQQAFPNPWRIIENYRVLYDHLSKQHPGRISIPPLTRTLSGEFSYTDEADNFWRATEFIPHTYSPGLSSNDEEAYAAAKSFAIFTHDLAGVDAQKLHAIIPGFHDLSFRYKQFEDAIAGAKLFRALRATHVIAELRQRHRLVDFFEYIKANDEYKKRVMHHDCKVSNILFDAQTNQAVCPVDLDTTMPGYYFSDLGDMIRTMACTVGENDVQWEKIGIKKSLYKAITEGYLAGMKDSFSAEELRNLHYSGLALVYMQSLRFVTDYLNNDIYYKISYEEQNLNRALNQLVLLERLEEFLADEYRYTEPLEK